MLTLFSFFWATQDHFEKLGAQEKLNLEVEFEDSNISLDIPLSSGVDINEWRLKPLVKPKVIFANSYQIMLVLRVLYADIKNG